MRKQKGYDGNVRVSIKEKAGGLGDSPLSHQNAIVKYVLIKILYYHV
jgi:hypothetical protein